MPIMHKVLYCEERSRQCRHWSSKECKIHSRDNSDKTGTLMRTGSMQESLDGKTSDTCSGKGRWWRLESRAQGQWAGMRQRTCPPIPAVFGDSVYVCDDTDSGRCGLSIKVWQMGDNSADNTCHTTPPAASSQAEASVEACQGTEDNIYKYLSVIKEKKTNRDKGAAVSF